MSQGISTEQLCAQIDAINRDMTALITELQRQRDVCRDALIEIVKGEAEFSLDQHQFACNVIERHKQLAAEALSAIDVAAVRAHLPAKAAP